MILMNTFLPTMYNFNNYLIVTKVSFLAFVIIAVTLVITIISKKHDSENTGTAFWLVLIVGLFISVTVANIYYKPLNKQDAMYPTNYRLGDKSNLVVTPTINTTDKLIYVANPMAFSYQTPSYTVSYLPNPKSTDQNELVQLGTINNSTFYPNNNAAGKAFAMLNKTVVHKNLADMFRQDATFVVNDKKATLTSGDQKYKVTAPIKQFQIEIK